MLTKYELIFIARQQGLSVYAKGKMKSKKQLSEELSKRVNLTRKPSSGCDQVRDERDFLEKQLQSLYEKYTKLRQECR